MNSTMESAPDALYDNESGEMMGEVSQFRGNMTLVNDKRLYEVNETLGQRIDDLESSIGDMIDEVYDNFMLGLAEMDKLEPKCLINSDGTPNNCEQPDDIFEGSSVAGGAKNCVNDNDDDECLLCDLPAGIPCQIRAQTQHFNNYPDLTDCNLSADNPTTCVRNNVQAVWTPGLCSDGGSDQTSCVPPNNWTPAQCNGYGGAPATDQRACESLSSPSTYCSTDTPTDDTPCPQNCSAAFNKPLAFNFPTSDPLPDKDFKFIDSDDMTSVCTLNKCINTSSTPSTFKLYKWVASETDPDNSDPDNSDSNTPDLGVMLDLHIEDATCYDLKDLNRFVGDELNETKCQSIYTKGPDISSAGVISEDWMPLYERCPIRCNDKCKGLLNASASDNVDNLYLYDRIKYNIPDAKIDTTQSGTNYDYLSHISEETRGLEDKIHALISTEIKDTDAV